MIADQAEMPAQSANLGKAKHNWRRLTKRSHVSPALWARMHKEFVQGNLNDLTQVAEELGVSAKQVRARAARDKWIPDRKQYAARVVAKTKASEVVEFTGNGEESAQFKDERAKLAQSVIALGQDLLRSAQSMSAVADTLVSRAQSIEQDGGKGASVSVRLEAVISARDATLEQLRVLAGLPEPGRVSHKPGTSTVPAQAHDPATFQPVGLAPEESGGGAG